LQGYDYSQVGAYYVTIVAQGRECLFGEIIDGEMYLSVYGELFKNGGMTSQPISQMWN